MKAVVTRKLNVAAPEVWDAISKVGRLDVWFPGIATCRVEGTGVGARRLMTLDDGGDIVDEIIDVDSEHQRLVYQRTTSPFPVRSYRGTVEVFESFDGLAIVAWTVDFESEPGVGKAVTSTLETAIGAGVQGLGQDLAERG